MLLPYPRSQPHGDLKAMEDLLAVVVDPGDEVGEEFMPFTFLEFFTNVVGILVGCCCADEVAASK